MVSMHSFIFRPHPPQKDLLVRSSLLKKIKHSLSDISAAGFYTHNRHLVCTLALLNVSLHKRPPMLLQGTPIDSSKYQANPFMKPPFIPTFPDPQSLTRFSSCDLLLSPLSSFSHYRSTSCMPPGLPSISLQ
jgi:hypothetical protein